MTQEKVLELLQLFEYNDIDVIVDGGWAVDALLGKQTREHNDLDLAVDHKYESKLRKILEENGYKEVQSEESRDINFVYSDKENNQLDIHIYEFDKNHRNTYGIEYPYESLRGTGVIAGKKVKCIAPEYMVQFIADWVHKWPEKYGEVIPELCEKYNLPLPDKYKKFIS